MATNLAEKIMTEPRMSPDDEGVVWERCHSAIFKVAAILLNTARKIQIPRPSTAEKYNNTAYGLRSPAEGADCDAILSCPQCGAHHSSLDSTWTVRAAFANIVYAAIEALVSSRRLLAFAHPSSPAEVQTQC